MVFSYFLSLLSTVHMMQSFVQATKNQNKRNSFNTFSPTLVTIFWSKFIEWNRKKRLVM